MTAAHEFDGPKSYHCFGSHYDTLTSVGVKPQGTAYPGLGALSESDAWTHFKEQERLYKSGAKQVAWRDRPCAVQTDQGWYVRARLTVFR